MLYIHIEEKRLIWFGHIRRANNRWINKVAEWSPMRRRTGRPRNFMEFLNRCSFEKIQ